MSFRIRKLLRTIKLPKLPQIRGPKPHESWLQESSLPKRRKIVVLGSGWGGYSFVNNINRDLFDILLISPRNHFLFTPLLASTCVGTLEFRCITEPIRHLDHINYDQSRCMSIDTERRVVSCRDSFDITNFYDVRYDYLIYACGSKSATFNIPGVEEHGHFLKQVRDAMKIRNDIEELFERASKPTTSRAERDRLLSFIVVGGGPTSIEFTGELHDWLMEDGLQMFPQLVDHVSIAIIEATGNILSGFGKDLAEYTMKTFRKRKIKIMTNCKVTQVTKDHVELDDGYRLEYGMVVWATGVVPVPLTESLDWQKSANGRLLVDDHLQALDLPGVFVIGDCSEAMYGALPPTAQVANQQGKYLAARFNQCLTVEADQFDHALNDDDAQKSFGYVFRGMMAYVGGWRGVVQFPGHLHANSSAIKRMTSLNGWRAWLFWRSVYFTKLRSGANQVLVPMYWFKAWLFGRDFSRF